MNVLVLYVGGTIGMKKINMGCMFHHHREHSTYLSQSLRLHNPALSGPDSSPNKLVLSHNDVIISYVIMEYDPLLDSSNMSVKEWKLIAKDIEHYYFEYDGFVVLQGTDTLAYASSALSFMLENLGNPVIFTGFQIPIFETGTDATNNLLYSLILAGCYKIPEVCVLFAKKMLRGNRTTKRSCTMLDAFVSPNYHHLAEVDGSSNITLTMEYLRDEIAVPLEVHTKFCEEVALRFLEALVQSPLKGLVIQSYGAGNIPSNRVEIVEVLQRAVRDGVLIVNVTQCLHGGVSAFYETGKALEDIGVIAGGDMTAESAIAKLCYVLGLPDLNMSQRIQCMRTKLRGEVSVGTVPSI